MKISENPTQIIDNIFRVHQCPLFLQHKCTQHRPFTCFHWHFQNQRRRQPIQKSDKSFNYSPDIYCSQYDETTGTCKKGDSCPLLHRVTGDTERRYHLRYYKTSACIHETDDNRNCEKNGPHCAFGHGHDDLRAPIFDASAGNATSATEIHERLNPDDNKWNDAEFVLSYYKTEACKKQPRFCRQGYACPHYHNAKDRRRNPKKFKYRSTPCPTVKKVGEDWQDPQKCDKGDNCPMCHTRTEQQFHPDIYKSTKCHDMQQTTYCPRGPFCAFAHVEQQEHDQNGHDGRIRSRADSDAKFELARERRRQQLEARQNNLRNSVSGDGSYRDQSTSFRDRTRSMGSFPRERPGASGTPTRESNSSFWPQQTNTACSSPIVQNMPSSHSPKNTNMESPGRNGQNGARMIRPSAWPPHPDREIEEKEIWSPEKTNGLNIFEDVTTEPSLVPYEEDTKYEYESKFNGSVSEEISRRRTQSASVSNHPSSQHSPPMIKEHDWKETIPSSPIAINMKPCGQLGSAILTGVYNSVGNGSGSNSYDTERYEISEMKRQLHDMKNISYQMKQELDYRKGQSTHLKELLHDAKLREQQLTRQLEHSNDHSNQLHKDRAKDRVLHEVRTCMAQQTRCPVPPEAIQQLRTQLLQDLDLLERALQS